MPSRPLSRQETDLTTPRTPEQVRAQRLATISRAVSHLTTADPAAVRSQLATTNIHAHWKQDPAGLAELLRSAGEPDASTPVFSAWIGARSVLRAAGLPEND